MPTSHRSTSPPARRPFTRVALTINMTTNLIAARQLAAPVIIYLTDLVSVLWWVVTGRVCLLFLGVVALIGFAGIAPLFGASINLGLRNASHSFDQQAKPFSGLFSLSAFDFFAHRLLNFNVVIAIDKIALRLGSVLVPTTIRQRIFVARLIPVFSVSEEVKLGNMLVQPFQLVF